MSFEQRTQIPMAWSDYCQYWKDLIEELGFTLHSDTGTGTSRSIIFHIPGTVNLLRFFYGSSYGSLNVYETSNTTNVLSYVARIYYNQNIPLSIVKNGNLTAVYSPNTSTTYQFCIVKTKSGTKDKVVFFGNSTIRYISHPTLPATLGSNSLTYPQTNAALIFKTVTNRQLVYPTYALAEANLMDDDPLDNVFEFANLDSISNYGALVSIGSDIYMFMNNAFLIKT